MDLRDGAAILGVTEREAVALAVETPRGRVEFCVERDASRWRPTQRIAVNDKLVERDPTAESLDEALARA